MSSVEPPASAGHSQQRLATMEEETKKDGEGGGAVFLTGMRAAAIGPAKDIESGGGGGDVAPAAEVYDEMGNNDRPTPVVSVFTILKIATALSALYMCTNPWFFFYDADKGEICPYTVICATTPLELTLLTLSRMSAGVLYGSLTISIMSKCYATRSFLHHSWLGAVLDLEPSHDVHTYFGYLTLAAGFEHGILHCIRFSVANQAWIITGTDTGRSGVVACILLLPIVLPMKFDWFKKRMSFQFRKNLHMLFLALLVALCFHSVHFRYVGSFLLIWYTLDRFYFTTKQTFLITRPVFEAVGRGTMVGLDLPEGYTFKAGSYIYVNSPTISRSEWHPFSIIQVPGKTPKAAFYAEAVGDWTKELFRLGLGQPRLPLWITAAQPSLMEKSIYYDNLVLVCTGAGITPAVSIIERFAKRKNIHLIWITRDSGMVALFEKQLRKVNSTVHLTGKQSDQTKDALRRLLDPPCSQEHNNASNASNGSFLSILNTDSFFRPASGGPSRPRLGSRDEDQAMRSAFAGSSAHSANHVVFADDYPHPRRMPTATSRSPRLPGGYNATPEGRNRVKIGSGEVGGGGPHEGSRPSRTERVSSAMSSSGRSSMRPAASPVQVVFGRPDIGKYLGETFASKTAVDDVNAAATAGSSDGKRGRRPRAGSDDRDELDASQKKSKAALMRANSEMTRSTGTSSRNNRFHSSSKKSSKAVTCEPGSRASGSSSSCPNPWLVLYCGANPKVEEAIAKTCDDLRVEWKKEYFGAW